MINEVSLQYAKSLYELSTNLEKGGENKCQCY
jgi:hypothetical protein